ncbi:hypothetical protein OEZ86_006872 [Tetradesmus obliquus]|nr:hypothetical protein OEZ86_006872 [Tetradesmus obliquus]
MSQGEQEGVQAQQRQSYICATSEAGLSEQSVPAEVVLKAAARQGHRIPNDPEQQRKLMRQLTHLHLNGLQLQQLQSLRLCPRLQVLYLYDNQLTSIASICSNRLLTHLYIQNNRLQQLNGLQDLALLQKLYLQGNCLACIDHLAACSRLEELHVSDQQWQQAAEGTNCGIQDPGPLAVLQKLHTLDLSGNSIRQLALLQPGTQDASVTYEQLYVSANHGTKVFLVHTPVGSCVLKRWASQRVRAGGNRFQPLAEHSALLDLHNVPNINAPIKITLDSSGADYIYVHCGNNALTWRARLEELHEHDAEQQQQSIEQLARHVAVHVLLALQELHKRGIVHRDVKPSNILLASPTGPTWLSDMGLATAAQQLPGFVKGLDLAYVPPEYITAQQQQWAGSSSSSGGWAGCVCWQVLDDLPALAQLTTAAADMYQLGLSIYQLLRGSLPQQLTPARAVAGSPRRLSSLLQKVATFDWKSEIQHSIMNSEAAECLGQQQWQGRQP